MKTTTIMASALRLMRVCSGNVQARASAPEKSSAVATTSAENPRPAFESIRPKVSHFSVSVWMPSQLFGGST